MNNNHYVVYNPYGMSYMSAVDTARPILTAKDATWALRSMENGGSWCMDQTCARKIARKKGKVADTIRQVLAQHHRL